MDNKKRKTLGIDIGSCNSSFVCQNEEGIVQNLYKEYPQGIPTRVWYYNKNPYIGVYYDHYCQQKNDSSKNSIGKTFQKERLIFETAQEQEEKLLTDFLTLIKKDSMAERALNSLSNASLVVGYPTISGKSSENYQEFVKKCIKEAWGDSKTILFCPEALAVAFAAEELCNRKGENYALTGNVLVVDMGGTTIDFAIVNKTIGENEFTLYDPIESEIVSGKGITKALWLQLDEADRTQYLLDIALEENKAELFAATEKEVPIISRGECKTYYLHYYAQPTEGDIHLVATGNEEKDSYSDYYKKSCQLVKNLLGVVREQVDNAFQLDGILFAGGCSRMKPVCQGMTEILRFNGFLSPKFKNALYFDELAAGQDEITTATAVAYGALLLGNGSYTYKKFEKGVLVDPEKVTKAKQGIGYRITQVADGNINKRNGPKYTLEEFAGENELLEPLGLEIIVKSKGKKKQ